MNGYKFCIVVKSDELNDQNEAELAVLVGHFTVHLLYWEAGESVHQDLKHSPTVQLYSLPG